MALLDCYTQSAPNEFVQEVNTGLNWRLLINYNIIISVITLNKIMSGQIMTKVILVHNKYVKLFTYFDSP